MDILALLADPAAWIALFTLIVLEVVLGIDNLVFIAILSNKLPAHQQQQARRLGLTLALVMRIGLLLLIGWIVMLQRPLVDLGIQGAPGAHGEPGFETAFSGRDLILLAGGLFLLWKATSEIHHSMDPEVDSGALLDTDKGGANNRGTGKGVVLIADAFGVHIPKGYIYAAMGFSAAVETLNIVSRNRRAKKRATAIQE